MNTSSSYLDPITSSPITRSSKRTSASGAHNAAFEFDVDSSDGMTQFNIESAADSASAMHTLHSGNVARAPPSHMRADAPEPVPIQSLYELAYGSDGGEPMVLADKLQARPSAAQGGRGEARRSPVGTISVSCGMSSGQGSAGVLRDSIEAEIGGGMTMERYLAQGDTGTMPDMVHLRSSPIVTPTRTTDPDVAPEARRARAHPGLKY